MPLTHEHWRDHDRVADAEDFFDRPRIKGKHDSIEVRDGDVVVRPFDKYFYGNVEGAHLTPKQQEHETARTLIEVKQLVIVRLKNRRAVLIARMNVLSKDPAFDARGAVEQLERERETEIQTHNALVKNLEKQKHGMSRIHQFFSERYGALYVPTVAVRISEVQLAGIEKLLEDMQGDLKKIKEVAAEMEHHKNELLLIDADQDILQEQMTELIASARKRGWVRDISTKKPKILTAPGVKMPTRPTRKRTLIAGA